MLLQLAYSEALVSYYAQVFFGYLVAFELLIFYFYIF